MFWSVISSGYYSRRQLDSRKKLSPFERYIYPWVAFFYYRLVRNDVLVVILVAKETALQRKVEVRTFLAWKHNAICNGWVIDEHKQKFI